jgi:hypothetical protein
MCNKYKIFFSFLLIMVFSNIGHTQTGKITISGRIVDNQSQGFPGATIYLRSGLDLSYWNESKTTTDRSGYYRFEGLDSGLTHIITPYYRDNIFEPAFEKIYNLRESAEKNFVIKNDPVPKKYIVSGIIKESNGNPVKNAKVMMNGSTAINSEYDSTFTDEKGYYKFGPLSVGGRYYFTVSKDSFAFLPRLAIFEDLNENKNLDFTGIKLLASEFKISGYIKDINSKPVLGAAILLLGTPEMSSIYQRVITDSNGYYILDNVKAGRYYSLLPQKTGYIFTPETVTYEVLSENKIQNFTVKSIENEKFSVSGHVYLNKSLIGIPNVTIKLNSYILSSVSLSTKTDSNGYYRFDSLKSSIAYILLPSKEEYGFIPSNIIINSLNNNTTSDFMGFPVKKSIFITGYIKDKNAVPVKDAVVVYYSDYVATTTNTRVMTDANGFYKIEIPYMQKNVSLAPYKDDYVFDPQRKFYELLDDDKKQDFLALPDNSPKYKISGYIKDKNSISISGVNLKLSKYDAVYQSWTAVTDNAGYYEFNNLKSGSPFSLYVSKELYIFDPQYYFIEDLKSNLTRDFTAYKGPIFISIGGYITTKNAKPIDSVNVYLSGNINATRRTTTNASGYYVFDSLAGGGAMKIFVEKKNYSFEPPAAGFEKTIENIMQNFTGISNEISNGIYSIKGKILKNGTVPFMGVEMNLRLVNSTGTVISSKLVVSDSNGIYEFPELTSGVSYLLYPYKAGYAFNPKTISIEKLSENKIINFNASQIQVFSVSGYIKDKNMNGISNVAVTIGSEDRYKTLTDSNGYYQIDNLEKGGKYIILPVKQGYKFDPNYKIITELTGNEKVDFTGIKMNSLASIICGFITGTTNMPIAGVSIILNGDEDLMTQTDENGFFIFDNVQEGKNYIVTPYKAGFTFYPPNTNVSTLNETKVFNSNGVLILAGINDDQSKYIPSSFKLYQNYPNPFNPETVIRFSLPVDAHVELKVFDIYGREIITLVNGFMNRGNHGISWSPKQISSGIYLYRVRTNTFIDTKKMIFLR